MQRAGLKKAQVAVARGASVPEPARQILAWSGFLPLQASLLRPIRRDDAQVDMPTERPSHQVGSVSCKLG